MLSDTGRGVNFCLEIRRFTSPHVNPLSVRGTVCQSAVRAETSDAWTSQSPVVYGPETDGENVRPPPDREQSSRCPKTLSRTGPCVLVVHPPRELGSVWGSSRPCLFVLGSGGVAAGAGQTNHLDWVYAVPGPVPWSRGRHFSVGPPTPTPTTSKMFDPLLRRYVPLSRGGLVSPVPPRVWGFRPLLGYQSPCHHGSGLRTHRSSFLHPIYEEGDLPEVLGPGRVDWVVWTTLAVSRLVSGSGGR